MRSTTGRINRDTTWGDSHGGGATLMSIIPTITRPPLRVFDLSRRSGRIDMAQDADRR